MLCSQHGSNENKFSDLLCVEFNFSIKVITEIVHISTCMDKSKKQNYQNQPKTNHDIKSLSFNTPSLWWLCHSAQAVIIEPLHSKPVKCCLRTIRVIITKQMIKVQIPREGKVAQKPCDPNCHSLTTRITLHLDRVPVYQRITSP